MQKTELTFAVLAVPVDVVLQLYAHLPLGGLVSYERVLQQLLCTRALCVVFQVTGVYKAVEALRPGTTPPPPHVDIASLTSLYAYVVKVSTYCCSCNYVIVIDRSNAQNSVSTKSRWFQRAAIPGKPDRSWPGSTITCSRGNTFVSNADHSTS